MPTLREIMSTDIPYLTVEDNVFEAATLMKKENVTFVPILEDERVKGIIRDRDVAVNGVAEKHPGSSRVTEIMIENFVSGEPDMSIDDAKEIMVKEKVWGMPIMEGKRLIGSVCLEKLLQM